MANSAQFLPKNETSSVGVLIIGGGSAGCVLASRLSEDAARQVMLVEAGEDFAPGSVPDVIRDVRFRAHWDPTYLWPGLLAGTVPRTDGKPPRRLPFVQARVIGGGSSINGMQAQRGIPDDFNAWSQFGVRGWSWDDVLPFFRRLETDLDFADADHGAHGPLLLRRVPEDRWSRLSQAFSQAVQTRCGIPALADINSSEGGDGLGAVPLNAGAQGRLSAADAYLAANVRQRANLTILGRHHATRILIEAGRATGAELAGPGGQTRIVLAGETIVCAGAVHSPALLMRSGIGPGRHLSEAGIAVASDRPGVGQRLQNHSIVVIGAHLRAEARSRDLRAHPSNIVVRYSSNRPDCPPTDMGFTLWERTAGALARDPVSEQIASLMVMVNKPYSMGSVALNRNEPAGSPQIDFRSLSDSRDRERMIDGVLLACALLADHPTRSLVNHVFVPGPTNLRLRLLKNDAEAAVLSRAGAVALTLAGPLRSLLLGLAGNDVETVIDDREALGRLIDDRLMPGGHPAGTCRMGRASDDQAVTDSSCRVIGIDRLRVVDASIFPTITTAGLNLPVMMAAEKIAGTIKADG